MSFPQAPEAGRPVAAHAVELTLGRQVALVKLAGEIDVAAFGDLTRLFGRHDLIQRTIEIDMTDVTFIDTAGLQPVVEAARRRQQQGLPGVQIKGHSPSSRRLLDLTGLEGEPTLNLDAWDRLPHWPGN